MEKVYIKVGDIPFTCRLVPTMGGKEQYGETNFHDQEIKVLETLQPFMRRKILLHELMHAKMCSIGRSETENMTTEELCEFIAFNAEDIVRLADEVMKQWNE